MSKLGKAMVLSLAVAALACGGKKDGDKGGSGDEGGSGDKGGGAAACAEKNEISVQFAADEDQAPGAFELKETTAFLGGMRYNGKATAKHANVVFANYDVVLGPYAVDLPKEAGQIAVVVSFKNDNVETTMEQQKTVYAEMKVPPGAYEPGWMKSEKSYQVSYFVGGSNSGPAISSDATGTATLTTSTDGLVCGSIDFTSKKGTTIKGTFNAKIEKDVWK